MEIKKNELPQSQIEVLVSLLFEEFQTYIKKGEQSVINQASLPGFRPGKAPIEMVKEKVGEMAFLEEAANLAISQLYMQVVEEVKDKDIIGKPQVTILKLAPENSFEYKMTFTTLPKVELGRYKDLGIKKEKIEIEEQEIDKVLANVQEMRAKEVIAERESKEGDKVLVKIEMFLDSIPVDGGQTNETAIILGSNYVVPGFDKNLVGLKKDEIREFKLPYPEDHYMRNLAGKLVEFKVTIKEVYERQLPELNNEFAQSFGVHTFEFLKENIKKSIIQEKEEKYLQEKDLEILDKVLENSQVGDFPDWMVNSEVDAILNDMQHNIEKQGGKFEDYLLSLKKSASELKLDLVPQAIKRLKSFMILRHIGKNENIIISDKQVEAEKEKILKQNKWKEKEKEHILSQEYSDRLKGLLINLEISLKLREWNLL